MQLPIGVGTSELNSNSQAGLALDIHCSKTLFQPQSLLTYSCYFQASIDYLPLVRCFSKTTTKTFPPSYCPIFSSFAP